jgi:hypothetical protein
VPRLVYVTNLNEDSHTWTFNPTSLVSIIWRRHRPPFAIAEFCDEHRFSRAFFYKLLKAGRRRA